MSFKPVIRIDVGKLHYVAEIDVGKGMEYSYETVNGNGHYDMSHSTYQPCLQESLPWLDLRVFYVRVSKCEIDDSTPDHLTLNHIPLARDTLLVLNGIRSNIYSDGISSLLGRDRLDKKSEEAIFVSTDSIRISGNVKFEVFDKEVLLLSGVLKVSDSNGYICESKSNVKSWRMSCESDIVTTGTGFLKGNQHSGLDSVSPVIEVYVAGSFSGSPIILTKTLHITSRKKQVMKGMLDAIPENETSESEKDGQFDHRFQMAEYENHKLAYDDDTNGMYSRLDYFDGEDKELSWFNSGVRVGVGIGLSVCLGIGMGVGLLARTYQGITKIFRRRLI